jgi:hypothetical protein
VDVVNKVIVASARLARSVRAWRMTRDGGDGCACKEEGCSPDQAVGDPFCREVVDMICTMRYQAYSAAASSLALRSCTP